MWDLLTTISLKTPRVNKNHIVLCIECTHQNGKSGKTPQGSTRPCKGSCHAGYDQMARSHQTKPVAICSDASKWSTKPLNMNQKWIEPIATFDKTNSIPKDLLLTQSWVSMICACFWVASQEKYWQVEPQFEIGIYLGPSPSYHVTNHRTHITSIPCPLQTNIGWHTKSEIRMANKISTND